MFWQRTETSFARARLTGRSFVALIVLVPLLWLLSLSFAPLLISKEAVFAQTTSVPTADPPPSTTEPPPAPATPTTTPAPTTPPTTAPPTAPTVQAAPAPSVAARPTAPRAPTTTRPSTTTTVPSTTTSSTSSTSTTLLATSSQGPSVVIAADKSTAVSSNLKALNDGDVSMLQSTAQKISSAFKVLAVFSALVSAGGVAFLLLLMRGTRQENHDMLFTLRRCTAVSVLAIFVSWGALLIRHTGNIFGFLSLSAWVDELTTSYAIGFSLLALGGMLVLSGFHAVRTISSHEFDPVAALLGDQSVQTATHAKARLSVEHTRVVLAGVVLSMLGAALAVQNKDSENFPIVIAVNAVHLAAAGVLGGALLFFALLFERRRKMREPSDFHYLFHRFLPLGEWTLAIAGGTGLMLAVLRLSNLGEIFGERFGQFLIGKLVLVALFVTLGHHARNLLAEKDRRLRQSMVLLLVGRIMRIELALLALISVLSVGLVLLWAR